MTDTTYDTARRCPTCEQLGQRIGTRSLPERGQGSLHIFRCQNDRCPKSGRDWIVQVRPDGSIPEPNTNREKSFPQEKGVARSRIEKAQASADRSMNQSLGK